MIKLKKIFVILTAFTPTLVSAQERLSGTKKFFEAVRGIVATLIPIAFGLALMFFFWGIAKYIWSAGSSKEEGKQIMLWGVIAVFVMSSIWGIVAFIGDSFGIDQETNMNIPTINNVRGSGSGYQNCAGEPGTPDCP